MERRVAVVLGYGILSDDRADGYRDYLESVAQQVIENEIDTVLLCGGASNPGYPGLTEARSMSQFLSMRLPGDIGLLFEERSLSTEQNIDFAAELMERQPWRDEALIWVLCDQARLAKVAILSLAAFGGLSPKQIYSIVSDYTPVLAELRPIQYRRLRIQGVDFSGNDPELLFRQTFAAPLDVMTLFCGPCREEADQKRLEAFGLTPKK